jgi:hypothetical protein
MAYQRRSFVSQGVGRRAEPRTSHREYVLDRAARIAEMFEEIRQSDGLREKFFADPDVVASNYNIHLSDEEVFAIRSMQGADLGNVRERLSIGPVAFFDANCSCAMFDKGLIQRR